MATSFPLEIVTPEKIVFAEDVYEVNVPGADGMMGILPHHVPLFARLTEGEVKVVSPKEEMYLAIGGGYIEVTPKKVTVLVSDAYKAEEINEREIMEAKKRAEEALKEKPEGDALLAAQSMLRRSTIALKLLEKRKRPGIPRG